MSLFVCLNGQFIDDNDQSKGCHLVIGKFHQQTGTEGSLQLVFKKQITMPIAGSTTAPSIVWTEDSERGRLLITTTHGFDNNIWFYRLQQRSLQVVTAENSSKSFIHSTRNTSLVWQAKEQLASIACGTDGIQVLQNVPEPAKPRWGGWQALTVREGLKTSPGSTCAPTILKVPGGAGYMWVLYTTPGPSNGHNLKIAILDYESLGPAQQLTTTFWAFYSIDTAFVTTDTFNGIFDEAAQAVHILYRGLDHNVYHFTLFLDEYGMPAAQETGFNSFTLNIKPDQQQRVPNVGNALSTRSPVGVIFGEHLYALWQRESDNKIVYSYAKKKSDNGWDWKPGVELADLPAVHDANYLWGFGACISTLD
ncbi:hypothetical protein CcaCcLH18_03437 [Colletotrichum camelliae]|nr:hypothetical protein CcaCcLH18_03437 [Colletotrichum camelliae]